MPTRFMLVRLAALSAFSEKRSIVIFLPKLNSVNEALSAKHSSFTVYLHSSSITRLDSFERPCTSVPKFSSENPMIEALSRFSHPINGES